MIRAETRARQLCCHGAHKYRSGQTPEGPPPEPDIEYSKYSSLLSHAEPPITLADTDMFVIIDMQNDFMLRENPNDPDAGRFGVSGGREIIPEIVRCVAIHRGPIALTRDYHPCYHVSFNSNTEHRHSHCDDKPPRPSDMPDGVFPPHCVFGTEGAKVAEKIHEACRKKENVKVFFKGFCPRIDSFGAAQYDAKYATERKLSGGLQICTHSATSSILGTGSYTFPGFTFDISHEPSESRMRRLGVAAAHKNCEEGMTKYVNELRQPDPCVSLEDHIRGSNVNRVVLCGLALDFCVIDTAITLKRALGEGVPVYIATDLSRPASYKESDAKSLNALARNRDVLFTQVATPVEDWRSNLEEDSHQT
jgi:nicotinamidase-related amidase